MMDLESRKFLLDILDFVGQLQNRATTLRTKKKKKWNDDETEKMAKVHKRIRRTLTAVQEAMAVDDEKLLSCLKDSLKELERQKAQPIKARRKKGLARRVPYNK